MADKKISALSAASLPLAGTEVLPIVQSGSTVKVSSDDLTVKNVRSNATTGLLQIAGPAAGATRVMTTPDANFTAARTDAANSFSGNQTLSDGDLVVGTAGKGIDFSANGGDVLSQYDEGTWTPNITAGTGTITSASATGYYTRIGRQVFVSGTISISNNGTGGTYLAINNLPFNIAGGVAGGTARESVINGKASVITGSGVDYLIMFTYDNAYPGGTGAAFQFSATYFV